MAPLNAIFDGHVHALFFIGVDDDLLQFLCIRDMFPLKPDENPRGAIGTRYARRLLLNARFDIKRIEINETSESRPILRPAKRY